MTNNNPGNKLSLPLVIVFFMTTICFVALRKWMLQWGIDPLVVIVGNFILFLVSLLSLILYRRAMAHASTMGFLRNTYSGLLLKLFVCIIAVLIYAAVQRSNVNKGGIFTCVFLYFVYALIEVLSLMQWNKARKNA
jgi:hypothetical protein